MKLNLRKTLFILPNLFTFSSIFCGFYAVVICGGTPSDDDFYRAALLIVSAMFFDTIDGRVARLTKTQSAFGVQVDSLADVLSFGVAPAILVYRWSLQPLGTLGLVVCFVYVAAGTARLARFNVLAMGESGAPKKPGKYILGLPIPGAAGILVSLVVANHVVEGMLPALPAIILAVVITLAFFMVSTIKFRSFKDLRLSWRTVLFVGVALGSSILIALMFHIAFALVWLLGSYVAIGVFESILSISRRVSGRLRDSSPELTVEETDDDSIEDDAFLDDEDDLLDYETNR